MDQDDAGANSVYSTTTTTTIVYGLRKNYYRRVFLRTTRMYRATAETVPVSNARVRAVYTVGGEFSGFSYLRVAMSMVFPAG